MLYADYFAVENLWDGIKIFVHGIRFDLAAIVYINALFILSYLLPFPFRHKMWYKKMQAVLFFGLNGYALLMELSDFAYFEFAFRRSISSDILLLKNTAGHLTAQYIKDFWWILALLLSALFLMNVLYKKTAQNYSIHTINFLPQVLLTLGLLPLFILAARGGWQLRPIMSITAAEYLNDMRQIPLMTNTTLNMIFSLQRRSIEKRSFFSEAAVDKIHPIHFPANKENSFRNYNVVILVMESFGKEYIGHFNKKNKTFTPFIDSLLQEGFYCKQSYANGLRSTQGIVALAAGLPSLMEDPLMFSAYQSNQIEGVASLFKKKGYQTAFFHGANPGSMEFERFSKLCGFDNYHDRRHYNNDADYDGNWGIWDIPFFQYAVQQCNQFEKPFFSMIFSLTSHHPYAVENWFEKKHPDMKPLFRSVKYADEALRKFFETAKQMDWYENTLFVITADHIGVAHDGRFKTKAGKYQIPILLFHPDSELRGKANRLAQQIDVLPTIMDYLDYDEPYGAFGRSMFDDSEKQYAYMFSDGLYQILDGQHLLIFDGDKTIARYDYKKDPRLKQKLKPSKIFSVLEKKIKAVIQQHDNRMIENRLYGL